MARERKRCPAIDGPRPKGAELHENLPNGWVWGAVILGMNLCKYRAAGRRQSGLANGAVS